jgi:hypothetical protein
MLSVRIKKRSDQYAAPRQDDDTGEGYQELQPPVCYQRPGSLTLMHLEAVSTAHDTPLALWVVEVLSIGYNNV